MLTWTFWSSFLSTYFMNALVVWRIEVYWERKQKKICMLGVSNSYWSSPNPYIYTLRSTFLHVNDTSVCWNRSYCMRGCKCAFKTDGASEWLMWMSRNGVALWSGSRIHETIIVLSSEVRGAEGRPNKMPLFSIFHWFRSWNVVCTNSVCRFALLIWNSFFLWLLYQPF